MQINSFKSHFILNVCMHLRIRYVVFRKEKNQVYKNIVLLDNLWILVLQTVCTKVLLNVKLFTNTTKCLTPCKSTVTQLKNFYLFIPQNALVQLFWNCSAIGG